MKRPYKEGDWVRIPLGGAYDALGVIARACRSRLFGYFFPVPADSEPAHEQLKALRAQDAALCALFGGAALDEARWRIAAAAVPFAREEWPFPRFALRGAFGRTWSVRTYDPQTLQVMRAESAGAAEAMAYPDARFYDAGELEALLRGRFLGVPAAEPLAVYDARGVFEPDGLRLLERGGRVQFSRTPSAEQMRALAAFSAAHPQVELRVHGFGREPFDAAALAPLAALQSLVLDAKRIVHPEALRELRSLRRLSTSSREALPLADLPRLRSLDLRGNSARSEAVPECAALESLSLIGTRVCAGPPHLRELTVAHAAFDPAILLAMPLLERVELRSLALRELPDFSRHAVLEELSLRGVRLLRDLRPLLRAPALRALRLEEMPQLEVPDFAPVAQMQLRAVCVDVESRRKNREIYRLLHVGKTPA